jgi:hypothetical protein
MGPIGAIEAIGIIQPTYVIPIHYGAIENLGTFLGYVPVGAPDIEVIETELVLK